MSGQDLEAGRVSENVPPDKARRLLFGRRSREKYLEGRGTSELATLPQSPDEHSDKERSELRSHSPPSESSDNDDTSENSSEDDDDAKDEDDKESSSFSGESDAEEVFDC